MTFETDSKEHVKIFNRIRAFHAERYLYSNTQDAGLSKLAVKFKDSGYRLALSGLGFHDEIIKADQYKTKSKGIVRR